MIPYDTQSLEHLQAGGYREKLAYGLLRPDSTVAETVNPGLGGGRLVHYINLPALRSKAIAGDAINLRANTSYSAEHRYYMSASKNNKYIHYLKIYINIF